MAFVIYAVLARVALPRSDPGSGADPYLDHGVRHLASFGLDRDDETGGTMSFYQSATIPAATARIADEPSPSRPTA